MKVAVTVRSACKKTVQEVPELVSQFPQVTEVEGLIGFALSETVVPVVNCAAHVVPQSMPGGALVMVPVPALMVTAKLLEAPPCGQPWLAGPSTIMWASLLTTIFEPSLNVAKTLAAPHVTFGLTTPPVVTCAT